MKGYSRDELFRGIEQVDTIIEGHKLRLPQFFRDTASFSALYPADIAALKALLPDNRLRPARLMPGIGILSISVLQHGNTDIRPYNEVIISAVLTNPDFANIPGYNLFQQVRSRQICSYIFHMPVSTEIARVSGVNGYGFARIRADISFIQSSENILCTLKDQEQLIFKFVGRKIETLSSDFMENKYYSYQNGLPQHCMVKTVALRSGRSYGSKKVELILGDTHKISSDLISAMISRRALMYTYAPRIQSVLFGPENIQPSLLKTQMESFFPQARLADKADRRYYAREKVDILCEIDGSTRGEKNHISAHVVNLSPKGMFVETGIPLDEDTEMRAAVTARHAENPVWVKGKVARLAPHGIAVSFTENIPPDLSNIIFH